VTGATGAKGTTGATGPTGPAGAGGRITCTITQKGLIITVTCVETLPFVSVAVASSAARVASSGHTAGTSEVRVKITRGRKTVTSGSGLLRKGRVSARLKLGRRLARGSYTVTVDLPGGARSAAVRLR